MTAHLREMKMWEIGTAGQTCEIKYTYFDTEII
jgi:hypothetical protein